MSLLPFADVESEYNAYRKTLREDFDNDPAFGIFVKSLFHAIADSNGPLNGTSSVNGTATPASSSTALPKSSTVKKIELKDCDLFHGHLFDGLTREFSEASKKYNNSIGNDDSELVVPRKLGILFHAKEYPSEYAIGSQILPVGHPRAGGRNDPRYGTTLSILDKNYPDRNLIWSEELDGGKTVFLLKIPANNPFHPSISPFLAPGVAGRRYFTVSEQKIGKNQLAIVSYWPGKNIDQVIVETLGGDDPNGGRTNATKEKTFLGHLWEEDVDKIPLDADGLPYFLRCRSPNPEFAAAVEKTVDSIKTSLSPRIETVLKHFVREDSQQKGSASILPVQNKVSSEHKQGLRPSTIPNLASKFDDDCELRDDLLACIMDTINGIIRTKLVVQIKDHIRDDFRDNPGQIVDGKPDSKTTGIGKDKIDALATSISTSKSFLNTITASISPMRLENVLRTAFVKYRKPGDDIVKEYSDFELDLAIGVLETSPWITNDVPIAVKTCALVERSGLLNISNTGSFAPSTLQDVLSKIDIHIQYLKDVSETTGERRFQFAIHSARANCCEQHAKLERKFLMLDENIPLEDGNAAGCVPAGPVSSSSGADKTMKTAREQVTCPSSSSSTSLASKEGRTRSNSIADGDVPTGDAWCVLVAGECGGVMVSDGKTRPGKYLGGHASLHNIGICYEKLVPWFTKDRIIVIAQLEETLEWLTEATSSYEKCCEMTGKSSHELYETLCRRLEETKRDCRVLLQNGGADYDYNQVNPFTFIKVMKGEPIRKGKKVLPGLFFTGEIKSSDFNPACERGADGSRVDDSQNEETEYVDYTLLPPPSSVLVLINTHGNTHPAGANPESWDEWYAHFPYPVPASADSIYSVAATQGFVEEEGGEVEGFGEEEEVQRVELEKDEKKSDATAKQPSGNGDSTGHQHERSGITGRNVPDKTTEASVLQVPGQDANASHVTAQKLGAKPSPRGSTTTISPQSPQGRSPHAQLVSPVDSPRFYETLIQEIREDTVSFNLVDQTQAGGHLDDALQISQLELEEIDISPTTGRYVNTVFDFSQNPESSSSSQCGANVSTDNTNNPRQIGTANQRIGSDHTNNDPQNRVANSSNSGNPQTAASTKKRKTSTKRPDWGAPKYRFRLYSQQIFQCYHDLTQRSSNTQIVALYQFCLSGGFCNFLTLRSYRSYFDTPRWPIFVMATSERYESALGAFMNLWVHSLTKHLGLHYGDPHDYHYDANASILKGDSVITLKQLFDQVREKYYKRVCGYNDEQTRKLIIHPEIVPVTQNLKNAEKEPLTVGTLNCHSGMRFPLKSMEEVDVGTLVNLGEMVSKSTRSNHLLMNRTSKGIIKNQQAKY